MIRVAIADDRAIVRRGLAQILSAEADLTVVGEASNHGEVMELVRKGGVDCLLLDIAMPGRNGIDTLKQVKAEFPRLKCFATLSPIPGLRGWLARNAPQPLLAALDDPLALPPKSPQRQQLHRRRSTPPS